MQPMQSPTVIDGHKKKLVQLGYRDLEHFVEDPNHLYIGRNNAWVKGAQHSIWHNPFSVKKYGLDECLRLYRDYIENNKELSSLLPTLSGKILVCWCKPNKCHGDILISSKY